MASTITYTDKVDLNTTAVADINKVKASDLNEIKSVVNTNATELTNVGTYSTTEVNTGKKWIDDKPIYRKVISLGNLPNNATKRVATGITNISYVIKLDGVASSGVYVITLPDVYPNNATFDVRLSYDLSTNEIVLLTTSDRTTYEAYAIVEYTKTTD